MGAGVLPQNGLRAIFGLRLRTWPDGSVVRVHVLRDDHSLHTQFCREVLGVFQRQMRIAWDRLVYSGAGQVPIDVDTEKAMRTEIADRSGGRQLSDAR